jgi:hypothetical protein
LNQLFQFTFSLHDYYLFSINFNTYKGGARLT